MEKNSEVIESLVEKLTVYGKTSFELAKLKTLDKTTNVFSTFVSHYAVLIIVLIFLIFASLGLAIWLGEIFGKSYYGLFAVAAFYGVVVIVLHFFLHEKIKRTVGNYFIKHMNN